MSSKIGIGYLGRGADQSLLDAGMRVSKWVNNPPPPNLPAGFTAVWRWVENPDNINGQFGRSPEVVALEWVNKQSPHFFDIPKQTFVEGPNENDCENPAQASWLSRFEIERMKLMETLGYHCCIFNFGTGRPSLPILDPGGIEIWRALLPALRYAKANRHLQGMHAYGYDLDPFGLLRYRGVYAWLPEDARPDLFIGEFGLDGAKGRFRDSSWRDQHPNPDAAYMDLIRAYDREIRKDAFARGFAIFTSGTNASSAWPPFDIAGQPVVKMIEDDIRSQAGVVDPAPAPVPPTPTPEPTPMPTTKIKNGDRVEIVSVDSQGRPVTALKARQAPGLDSQTQRVMKAGDKATVVGDPVSKDGIDWPALVYDNRPIEFSSAGYLRVIDAPLPTPGPVPIPAGGNLLINGDLDSGMYHWHDVPEITIPSMFDFWYALKGAPRLERQDDDWYPPETVVWNRAQAPAHEQGVFWLSGAYCLKVFKGWGPIHWKLFQTVRGLVPGQRYRFTAPVYPDLVMAYRDGNKVFADDPLAGEIRLSVFDATDGAVEAGLGWIDGSKFKFGEYTRHEVDFTAPGSAIDVSLECRGRWGLVNNGWFVDSLKLERMP